MGKTSGIGMTSADLSARWLVGSGCTPDRNGSSDLCPLKYPPYRNAPILETFPFPGLELVHCIKLDKRDIIILRRIDKADLPLLGLSMGGGHRLLLNLVPGL
jgi:hypothetical protein